SPLPAWLSFNDKTQTFSGTPSFNDSDMLNVKVTASDGKLVTTQVFVLDVKNVNQTPVAVLNAPLLVTDEDVDVNIDLLARVTDPDNDVVMLQSLGANNGGLTLNADQTVTYTPFANFNGIDTITYTVKDELGATFTRTEQITINAVNDAPQLLSTPAILNDGTEDTAYTINTTDLLQGFVDVDGDSLSVANLYVTEGQIVSNQDGTFTFNPSPNFFGTVSLGYQVSDGNGGLVDISNTLTLASVNDAPVAPSAPISITNGIEDVAYTMTTTQLLAGFSDVDGDVLSVVGLTSDSGFLQDNADGTYTLTPNANFNGNITLNYQVSDGKGGVVDASNSFVVDAVNDAPELLSTPAILNNGTEDTAYTIQASDLLQGFSDVDGDTLSVINLSSSSGFLQDNQDGTYTLTPNTNFNGLIQLDYQVDDGNGGVVDASNSVFIQAVNDAPVAPSSPISLASGTEDTAYTIHASDLLQGFSDIDSPSLSVVNLTSSSGFLQDNQDGTYTFSPNSNFNGTVQLTTK
ncbi:MAG: cadherin-like domain-containing protein, partial [Moraxellaceae bacterium]|nr:cadherin-like domain-containing protein [Moraxellaceae bacterium]